MAYVIQEARAGMPQITAHDTVAKLPLGTRVKAVDPTYGEGEFVYQKGVASCAAASWVTLNPDDGVVALLAANAIGPVGIAMAATVADEYGWFQIYGKAVGKALAAYADNGLVFATATAGSVDDAVVDGDMVHLAKGASALDTPSTGLAEFEIAYPYTDDIAAND